MKLLLIQFTAERTHEWYMLTSSKSTYMNFMTSIPAKVWPNGIVYYRFHESVSKFEAHKLNVSCVNEYCNKSIVVVTWRI